MRKRSLAALCTATALGIALAIPTAAQAADPHASGFKVWTDYTRIYLDFGDHALPKELKVHVRKAGTDIRVATVTAFEPVPDETPCTPSCQDDDGESGIRSAPLRLADLGQYSLDVHYRGTLGESIRYPDKATLAYGLIPRVTALEVVGKPDLENRTVTVKADTVGRDPRNDTEHPLPHGKLVLESSQAGTPMVADAAGHIEAPFTFAGTEQGEWYPYTNLRVTLRPEKEGTKSPLGRSLEVRSLPRTSEITLDTTTVRAPDGSQAPVSGRLTFKGADGTMKPVPAGYRLYSGGQEARTGADGRFTTPVTVDGRRSWLLAPSQPAWLTNDLTPVAVDPTTSAGIHGTVTAAVSPDQKVTVTGKLYAYDLPAPAKLQVLVEFQPFRTSKWITKTTRLSAAPAGDSTRVVTAASLPYPGPGKWRLRYTGTPEIPAGPGRVSDLAARSWTAIAEFNAAPEPVKAGLPIEITGKLTKRDYWRRPWVDFPIEPVHIYFRATGTTTWVEAGIATTAADGTFKKAFTATKDGAWQARYEPAGPTGPARADHFAATSREDLVDVQ